MADGLNMLERRIKQFEDALEEMRLTTSEAHSALKQLREERRLIENLLKGDDVKKLVSLRVNEVIVTTLDEIGPHIRQQTNEIYAKVGEQIDKLIDIALGDEFAKEHDRIGLRSQLAVKLKIWIREVIDKEGYEGLAKALFDEGT